MYWFVTCVCVYVHTQRTNYCRLGVDCHLLEVAVSQQKVRNLSLALCRLCLATIMWSLMSMYE